MKLEDFNRATTLAERLKKLNQIKEQMDYIRGIKTEVVYSGYNSDDPFHTLYCLGADRERMFAEVKDVIHIHVNHLIEITEGELRLLGVEL